MQEKAEKKQGISKTKARLKLDLKVTSLGLRNHWNFIVIRRITKLLGIGQLLAYLY